MALYCYFIARAHPKLENLPYRTFHAAPLHFVKRQDLVVAVRSLPPGTRSSPQLMLEHSAALAAASQHGAVLPLRFGTSFRSETAVVQMLAARGPELVAALERLESKVEMSVRFHVPEDESVHKRAAEISQICSPLDSWVEVRPHPAGGKIVEVVHLIPRQDVDSYRKRLGSHVAEAAGPRPPFHFLPQFLRWPVRPERRSGRSRSVSSGDAA